MDKKNMELANVTIGLSIASLAIYAATTLLLIIVSMLSFGAVFGLAAYSDISIALATAGLGTFIIGICLIFIAGALAIRILALVFAVKGKRQESRKFVLIAAILNSLGLFSANILAIASAVCGYVWFARMAPTAENNIEENKVNYSFEDEVKQEEPEYSETQVDVMEATHEYKDIYGMK